MVKYIRKYPIDSISMLFLITMVTLLSAFASYKLSDLVNSLEANTMGEIYRGLFTYVIFQCLSIAVLYVYNMIEANMKKKIRMDIREHVIHNTVCFSVSDFYKEEKNQFSDIHVNNIETYSQDYLENIYNGIYYSLVVVSGIVLFCILEPIIGILLVIAVVLSYFVAKFYDNTIPRITENYINSKMEYNAFVEDVLNGFIWLYMYRSGKYFFQKGKNKVEKYEEDLRNYKFRLKWITTVIYLPMFLIDFLLIGTIIYLVITNKTEIGTLAAYLNIGGLILNASEGMFSCLTYIKAGESSLDNKIYNYAREKKTVDVNDTISTDRLFDFFDVGYSINGVELLKPKNIAIHKGEKLLITGANGSGKSTFFRLINKILENTNGSIYYKGKNYGEILEEDIFSEITYLRQESYIFEGTLYENIFFDQVVSPRFIEKIVQASQLTDFVKKHNEGLSFFIKGNGEELSGGEKRKICIARMLANSKDILLLDEPFAGIDIESVRKIEDILVNEANYTIVMITHDVNQLCYDNYKNVKF